MRIKNFFQLLITVLFLGSCGSSYTVVRSDERQKSNTPLNTEGDYVERIEFITEEYNFDTDYGLELPEDPGLFKRFEFRSTEEYIKGFAPVAKIEMMHYGIPASITLAQGILESGAGRSNLVQKSNNHFGIKCHQGWNGPWVSHDDDAPSECFRKYNLPIYSYRDHSVFLRTRNRYASLFTLAIDDYKSWARGLKKAGYATDPKYPQKLISIIENYRLYRYDNEVLKSNLKNKGWLVMADMPKIKTKKPQQSTDKIQVRSGDTLYSISRRYGVSVDELKRANALEDNIISIGQELIIRQ